MLEQAPASRRFEHLLPPAGRATALPIGDGRYAAIPPERLRILIKVYNLIVARSIEERMLSLQQRRRRLAAGVLGRDGDEGAGDQRDDPDRAARVAPTSFTARDVESLLAPLSDGAG